MGRIIPARYDIKIYKNATFSETFQFLDENEQPMNLSGCQAYAQAWAVDGSKREFSFDTSVDGSNGKVTISLSHTVTSSLNVELRAQWDLLIVWPDGTRDYFLEGAVTVDRGYTTP